MLLSSYVFRLPSNSEQIAGRLDLLQGLDLGRDLFGVGGIAGAGEDLGGALVILKRPAPIFQL